VVDFSVSKILSVFRKIGRFFWGMFRKLVFLLGFLSFISFGAIIYNFVSSPSLKTPSVLVLELSNRYPEIPGHPLSFIFGGNKLSFYQLIQVLDKAKQDPFVKVVAVYCHDSELGLAQIQEIRNLFKAIRKHGKPVYFYASSFGELSGGVFPYYLASSATKVFLQPIGALGFTGFGTEMLFFGKILDEWKISPQFAKGGAYKSLTENLTHDKMSSENRKALLSIFSSFETQIVSDIASDRKLSKKQILLLLHTGPHSGEEALKQKLIDGIVSPAEFDSTVFGSGDEKYGVICDTTYYEIIRKGEIKNKFKEKIFGRKECIAFIGAAGSIGQSGFSRFEEDLNAVTLSKKLDCLADDPFVKAVVIRFDTPGGDVLASEMIRLSIERCRDSGKSVVVSMGDTAASGGYWAALGADEIISDPGTVTGSIGIIGGKMEISGLLKKFNIYTDSVSTSENALISSPFRPFSKHDWQKVNEFIEHTYARFIGLLAEKRKMSLKKAHEVAQGRVWTGEQAKQLRLVDYLGGILTAIERARLLAKLDPDVPVYDVSQSSGMIPALSFGDFGVCSLLFSIFLGKIDLSSLLKYKACEPFLSRLRH